MSGGLRVCLVASLLWVGNALPFDSFFSKRLPISCSMPLTGSNLKHLGAPFNQASTVSSIQGTSSRHLPREEDNHCSADQEEAPEVEAGLAILV